MNRHAPPPPGKVDAIEPEALENAGTHIAPYQRLRNAAAAFAAEGSRPANYEREILSAIAEMVDADSAACVFHKDGSLVVTELALDARHQGLQTALSIELRMAASEALRGSGASIEPSANLRNAVTIASALPDRSGAIAIVKRGDANAMAAARAVLELAAQALFNAKQSGEAGLGSALTRIAKETPSLDVVDDVSLAARLRTLFGARQVIVGTSTGRISAMAPIGTIRHHSPTDRMMATAFFRAWSARRPIVDRADQAGGSLANALNTRTIVAMPLDQGDSARDRIALLVGPDQAFNGFDADEWGLVQALLRSAIPAAGRRGKRQRRSFGGRTTLAVSAAALLVLLIPIPDRIRADATLMADGRRYVVANFAAVLKDTKVAPGDVVKRGELVGSLEGEALRLERTASAAKAEEARRKEDAALREKKVTQAELARIEGKAATADKDLLDWQIGHLELRAPVDGVVLSNPFEHSAGAPVREGDTIMEIAPINRLRVRVEVPVTDLRRIPDDPTGSLYLDGVPGEAIALSNFSWAARAEAIDGKTVIPLRTIVDNPKLALRPGQAGIAILPTGKALLGEILFRNAWDALRKWWL